jgi:hypothetical protein
MRLLRGNQQSNPLSVPIPSVRDIGVKAKGHMGPKSRAAQVVLQISLCQTKHQLELPGCRRHSLRQPGGRWRG